MKIVISGNYGAGNIGDEMILEGMLYLLNDGIKGLKITVLSETPSLTSKKYGVKSVKKFPSGLRSLSKNIFKKSDTKVAVKNCDYFILGGGGLFGGPERRGNYVWAVQAFMALFYKKPLLMIGQSVGNKTSIIEKYIIKKLFSKSKLIVVREKVSKKNLIKLGIKKKIYVYPDLALSKSTTEAVERKKNIIIALRKTYRIKKDFFKQIAGFIDSLPNNYRIKFINFKKGSQSDQKFHQNVIDNIKSEKNVIVVRHNEESDKVIKHFKTAEFAICMRLHSVITAILTQTPFVALNYSSKVKSFTTYANLGEFTLEMDEVNSKIIKEKMTESKLNQIEKIIKFKHKSKIELTKLKILIKEVLVNNLTK